MVSICDQLRFVSQLVDSEKEKEGLQRQLESALEREGEQLRASLSLAGLEREKMELKIASQNEAISELCQQVGGQIIVGGTSPSLFIRLEPSKPPMQSPPRN